MTRLLSHFADLDGRGYGVRVEVPPVHPGLAAAVLPWRTAAQHAALMREVHHIATFIILTRDYYGGEVRLDKSGGPRVHYRLHRHDARHLMHGLQEALKLHQAAGAQTLYSPYSRLLTHENGAELTPFLREVGRRGFPPNGVMLFSAHQMSSCRIGGTAEVGALKPNGESWELKNLYVADGSVLPTASGVNPMISIMGTAHFLAQGMK
jgi:choline dehydrogenase-like flavoprotein